MKELREDLGGLIVSRGAALLAVQLYFLIYYTFFGSGPKTFDSNMREIVWGGIMGYIYLSYYGYAFRCLRGAWRCFADNVFVKRTVLIAFIAMVIYAASALLWFVVLERQAATPKLMYLPVRITEDGAYLFTYHFMAARIVTLVASVLMSIVYIRIGLASRRGSALQWVAWGTALAVLLRWLTSMVVFYTGMVPTWGACTALEIVLFCMVCKQIKRIELDLE